MAYYFITYQATSKGGTSIWNQVIDISPMEFIKSVQKKEERGSNTYINFLVINTCEISKEDFNKHEYEF